MLHNRKTLCILLLLLLFTTACATTPKTGGVYHTVEKGETLWRIAQAYNCDPNEIARANNLPDTTIVAGSALFIPNATKPISTTLDTLETEEPSTATQGTPHAIREETLEPAAPTGTASSPTVTPAKKAPELTQKSSQPRFIWPVEGTVSSKFGTYKGQRHNGIKIDGREGTPILAAAGGMVTYSAPMKYFGETTIIKHSDTYSTVYSQLKKRMVSVGSTVKQRDRIGLMGKEENGKSRLSFEIRRKNRAQNPLRYLPKKNREKQ